MTNIFLLLKGFFGSLWLNEPKCAFDIKYYCFPSAHGMGVALEQPHLCKVKSYSLSSVQSATELSLLENLYRFLYGINSINVSYQKKIKIVLPYYWYWLVIMNLPYWSKRSDTHRKAIKDIVSILDFMARERGHRVEVGGSWSSKPGLTAAKKAVKDEYRLEQ